jgi:hypothetical protein
MTVDIAITGELDDKARKFGLDNGLALGGPHKLAKAMRNALAKRLDMEPPPDGSILNLTLTMAELHSIMVWLHEHYPTIGFVPMSEEYAKCRRSRLTAAPVGDTAPASPWREFELRIEEGLPMTDDKLVWAIALAVDLAHAQKLAWVVDLETPVSVICDYDPPMVINIEPGERTIYVDAWPADQPLPTPADCVPTPYANQTIH